jgi:hypothetical protein
LREELHDWYFSKEAGGLFLSREASEAYFGLQNAIQEAASRIDPVATLGDDDSIKIRAAASNLRRQLVADLGTAEHPDRSWTAPRHIPPPDLVSPA